MDCSRAIGKTEVNGVEKRVDKTVVESDGSLERSRDNDTQDVTERLLGRGLEELPGTIRTKWRNRSRACEYPKT